MKTIFNKKSIFNLMVLFFSSCSFSPKFSGPKFDIKTNKLMINPNQEVVLALTNAKLLRSKRSGFDSRSREIFKNIKSYDGYIGGTVKVEVFGDEVWTMTVWEDEISLNKFVESSRHLDAMYMTSDAMVKFKHTHLKVQAKDLPYSWSQVQNILDSVKFEDRRVYQF